MPSATPSQTIGPYWHLIEHPEWADLTRFGAQGEVIRLTGRIVDGGDVAVTNACVEVWQADPQLSEHFPGFGRCRTDQEGRFTFTTLKPGPAPMGALGGGEANTLQAPHLAVAILARGLLRHLATRLYFAGEALNAQDPVLLAISEARRTTLIVCSPHPGTWQLDVRLQGGDETVFLEV
jgi:protocatechuate 3,4-dioxygenase alpha subunit